MTEATTDKFAEETQELWRKYSDSRSGTGWDQQAKEDVQFRFGTQWSKEEKEVLDSRGQAAIVVNRIHPAVEAMKAMITYNKPGFRVTPREDSDNKTAHAFNGLLSYMWQISSGNAQLAKAVDDMLCQGVGWLQCYIDPIADMGKGEVMVRNVDPMHVYVDPKSQHPFFDDARSIIISRLFTKEQAEQMYPLYASAVKNAEGSYLDDTPNTGRISDTQIILPEDVYEEDDIDEIRGYERYDRILKKYVRVFNTATGKEDLLTADAFKEYIKTKGWIVEGKLYLNPEVVQQLMMAMQQQGRTDIQVQEVTFKELIEMGVISSIQVKIWRIKMSVVVGNKTLYKRTLPVEHYPIVDLIAHHTRTPYPTSDVRMVKDLQEYINKIRSLIIAHAANSTNVKILIPKGSVDMDEFEQKWSQPSVALEVDMEEGMPIPIHPVPMPTELYKNEQEAKNDIDHQMGLYELSMGNAANAPTTYKATLSIDEFGQRRIKTKLSVVEEGLKRLCTIAIPFMQELYTTEKIVRLLEPNNSMSEYAVNKRLYDEHGQVLETMNDIGVGAYDVVVAAGSTLPSNRLAMMELYQELYAAGIIDRVEVLKKTELFDMEGIMQRTDEAQQMQQQMQQMQEEIKKLQGDLQTAERVAKTAREQAELEKFKSSLKGQESKAGAATDLYKARLNDAAAKVKEDAKREEKERQQNEDTLQKQAPQQ